MRKNNPKENIKMDKAVKRWIEEKSESFLRKAGIKEGQTILDFGCNDGNYTISAACIIGSKYKVYALDKEGKSLAKTIKTAKSKGLENVVGLLSSNELEIPLRSRSIDVVLLYDVLHRGYFPEQETREKVLQEVYRVLKPNGFISVYPTHLKKYGMTFNRIIDEIQNAGFNLERKFYKNLVHDDRLVKGCIFNFRKE